MKKLSIICALVMVFSVSLAQAQQYEVTLAGDTVANAITAIGVPPNASLALDVYATGMAATEASGGFWLDFTGSTADIAYVSAGRCMTDGSEGCTGPWSPGFGVIVEPATGNLLLQVANLAGAATTGGAIIIGTVTLQNTGPVDATVAITTIPSVLTWGNPTADTAVGAGSLVVSQICDCTTDADCIPFDDGNFCNGVPICSPICVCSDGPDPCADDGDECTLDCDEDTDSCNSGDVCDPSVISGSTDPCCASPSPCASDGTDPQDICGAEITLIKESGYYQPAGAGEVVTIKNKICLNNPSDLVGGIQFDICDSPDCLTCIDCELTERTVMFDCVVLELPNGCCRVIMFCKNPGCAINPGECDIVTVVMQTNDNEECGDDCIVEVITGIVASDYDGFPLAGAGIDGSLCPVVCGDVCPPGSGTANDCGDGVVDIYDIMCEVDFALTATVPNDCQAPRADVPTGTPGMGGPGNDCIAPDGVINILDIMVLIDMALNRQDCCSFYYQGIIY
jgi:hypothetical protein